MLATSSTDAISPTHISAISMWSLEEIQSSVGTYQKRIAPRPRASFRDSAAERMPCAPISPRT